jgi:flagellar motor component MotA
MIFLAFILIYGLLIAAVYIAGASMSVIFDAPTFAIVMLPGLILMLLGRKWTAFVNGLKVMWNPAETLSGDKRRQARVCFDMLFKATMAAGFTGTLIGVAILMSSAPDAAEFFKGFSVAILSTIHGLIFAFFLYYPALVIIERGKD